MAGTYVAATFDKYSQLKLKNISRQIPNPVPPEEYHCTVIYSEVEVDVEIAKYTSIETISGYEVWPNNENNGLVLVARLRTGTMNELHEKFMKDYPNLTYTHDSYKPHVTLSYDVPKDILNKVNLPKFVGLVVNSLYKEKLKPN